MTAILIVRHMQESNQKRIRNENSSYFRNSRTKQLCLYAFVIANIVHLVVRLLALFVMLCLWCQASSYCRVMGRAFNCVCEFVCLCFCLNVF